MKMIRAIVRPERVSVILEELLDAGYPAVTKTDVVGRGKQRGIKVGNVRYDELQKEMLLLVVEDEEKDEVVKLISKNAKTGEGVYGDGKIFVTPVEDVYTISSGVQEL
ncbi:P-II family nitrogen regulator [Alkalibacter saccharofermentans]|uniref:Nitrogen regulatory protein P-II family n=1 Tax=Alkalibacter saccharofermentans DSM 14828 TaxID=1120975 RepID=A0A1M4S460_9FIRM|nr:P-II family nitrogen regulator [Alkalibacter saccharofermentans]SHE27006.1 nitrogen regulatory protein P-II family [Alkalibacter saccharofermentans DSM 14828]